MLLKLAFYLYTTNQDFVSAFHEFKGFYLIYYLYSIIQFEFEISITLEFKE